MRVYTAEDFEAIIAGLPQTPDNQSVYNALMAMRDENSVERTPYNYEVDFATTITQGSANFFPAPTAAGGQSVGNFIVDASAPFMLVSLAYQADIAGAAASVSARAAPNVVISISDQSSGKSWMNTAVPIPSIFGNGTLPYFLPQPRLIPGNTNLQLTLTNYDAASVPNIRLTFSGYRIYNVRSQG